MGKERIEYLSEAETSFEQLLESIPEMRFPKGTWYKTKLHESLEQAGLLHLEHDCLLSKDVQAKHAAHLFKKTKIKFKNISRIHRISADGLHENFRFITILDSVVPLNHDDALKKISEFRQELVKLFKKFRSFWVAGAIEVEIVNLAYMKAARSVGGPQEFRKLELCEKLLDRDVGKLYQVDDCYLLIHFHGLIYHPYPDNFDRCQSALAKNKRWSFGPRQVQFTKLSESWRGEPRTVRKNAEYLCNYITKGGTDRLRENVYMRYKFNYEHQGIDDDSQDEVLDSTNVLIMNKLKTAKVEDYMSWTNLQIAFMSKLTHSMMYQLGMRKDKKVGMGHLIILAYRSSRNKLT